MIVSAVVAIAENRAIGKDNELLWHLPKDLKHFKEITKGHTIIMGRKTFDSIRKPLPHRRNIVVTRQKDLEIEGAEVVGSVDEALALCADEKEVFIVGGAEIYNLAMPRTDRIYLTTVHETYQADAFFPELNKSLWKETESQYHEPDDRHSAGFTFTTLERI